MIDLTSSINGGTARERDTGSASQALVTMSEDDLSVCCGLARAVMIVLDVIRPERPLKIKRFALNSLSTLPLERTFVCTHGRSFMKPYVGTQAILDLP